MLDTIVKDPGCILLAIAPVDSEGKYITNKTLKANHVHGDLIPKWERYMFILSLCMTILPFKRIILFHSQSPSLCF